MADFGLVEVVAVPVQGAAGDKASQEVISAEGSAGSNDEQAQGGREEDVGLVVDPLPRGRLDLAAESREQGALDTPGVECWQVDVMLLQSALTISEQGESPCRIHIQQRPRRRWTRQLCTARSR